jgi:hypothetical protein
MADQDTVWPDCPHYDSNIFLGLPIAAAPPHM